MIYLSVLTLALITACVWLVYELGQARQTLKEMAKYEYMFQEAKKARDSLSDKSVRSELREKTYRD